MTLLTGAGSAADGAETAPPLAKAEEADVGSWWTRGPEGAAAATAVVAASRPPSKSKLRTPSVSSIEGFV